MGPIPSRPQTRATSMPRTPTTRHLPSQPRPLLTRVASILWPALQPRFGSCARMPKIPFDNLSVQQFCPSSPGVSDSQRGPHINPVAVSSHESLWLSRAEMLFRPAASWRERRKEAEMRKRARTTHPLPPPHPPLPARSHSLPPSARRPAPGLVACCQSLKKNSIFFNF